MTKKLDNTTIASIASDFATSYTTAETTLYEVYKALTVLTQSVNFYGEAADKHKAFLQDASLNYAYVLLEITQSVKTYIDDVAKVFLEYESDETGKVNTDTVSDYRTSLSAIKEKIATLKTELDTPEKTAKNHHVSIISNGADNLADIFSDIDSGLEKVNQDLADKDTELKEKATTVCESMTTLQSNLAAIASTYITPSGKYNTSTIGQLTSQDWYTQGNNTVFAAKQEEDPYAYNTGHGALFEKQYAIGLAKNTYSTAMGSVLSGQYEVGEKDGENYLKANGSVAGGKLQVQGTSAVGVTASANFISGDVDLRAGKSGLYASGSTSAFSAQGQTGIIDGLFSVNGDVKIAYADGTVGIYNNEDEFYYGFDAKASWLSASAQFDLLNVELPGMDKPILATSFTPRATAGGGGTFSISGESVYENLFGIDWLDIDTVTVKAGAELGIGGDISVTIPWLDLNF